MRKHISLIILFFIFFGCNSSEEIANSSVYEGDLNISTQAEIDTFNYSKVTGYIQILGETENEITNLNGLKSLTYVGKYLGIDLNNNLRSLNGLENLKYIGEQFSILGAENLTSIEALRNLTHIGDHCTIHNTSLVSLNGFNNLKEINGVLSITGNPNLASLNGLQNLIKIKLDLIVTENKNLLNFNGLDNINHIGRTLYILRNNNLQNFNIPLELEELKSIYLAENKILSSLDELKNLNTSNIERIEIIDNQSLIDYCGIRHLVSNDMNYWVKGNAYNPTKEQVQNEGSGGCSQ